MKISAYGYLFNARKFSFNIEETVANFCAFFDDVVCATVPSEDDTREVLTEMEKKYSNFRVIDSDIKILGNNRFDGQLKTLAMKNCANEIRVIVDYDEKFILTQRPIWNNLATHLVNSPQIDGFLIPVLNLFGSKDKIKANENIGQKFRIHKKTVVERGVVKEAELGNGLFRTDISDSTEALVWGRKLANFATLIDPLRLNPIFAQNLINYPYVVHFGDLDLERRAKIGREFWAKAWSERSGKPENVITDAKELDNVQVISHNLPIS